MPAPQAAGARRGRRAGRLLAINLIVRLRFSVIVGLVRVTCHETAQSHRCCVRYADGMDASAKRQPLTTAERSRESRARRLERGEPSVATVDRALRTVVLNRARTVETVSLDDLIPEVVNLLMSPSTWRR